jgi:hypothetical protein
MLALQLPTQEVEFMTLRIALSTILIGLFASGAALALDCDCPSGGSTSQPCDGAHPCEVVQGASGSTGTSYYYATCFNDNPPPTLCPTGGAFAVYVKHTKSCGWSARYCVFPPCCSEPCEPSMAVSSCYYFTQQTTCDSGCHESNPPSAGNDMAVACDC